MNSRTRSGRRHAIAIALMVAVVVVGAVGVVRTATAAGVDQDQRASHQLRASQHQRADRRSRGSVCVDVEVVSRHQTCRGSLAWQGSLPTLFVSPRSMLSELVIDLVRESITQCIDDARITARVTGRVIERLLRDHRRRTAIASLDEDGLTQPTCRPHGDA
jgi:hypothetical protein